MKGSGSEDGRQQQLLSGSGSGKVRVGVQVRRAVSGSGGGGGVGSNDIGIFIDMIASSLVHGDGLLIKEVHQWTGYHRVREEGMRRKRLYITDNSVTG